MNKESNPIPKTIILSIQKARLAIEMCLFIPKDSLFHKPFGQKRGEESTVAYLTYRLNRGVKLVRPIPGFDGQKFFLWVSPDES